MRKLSTVEQINDLRPHPNSDILELATLRDAEVQSELHSCLREGVVWRPCKEQTHHKLGRLMFKAISNAFLLKNKD